MKGGTRSERARRKVLTAAFILHILSFVFFFIGFVSPYWFQSWERVHSPFKRIGLWEVCFAGMILPTDIRQKAYHGCWWLLTSYFNNLRDWLMPWWFILTMVVETIMLILLVVNLILTLVIWATTGTDNRSGTGKKRMNVGFLNISAIITVIEAFLQSAVVLLFGLAVYVDRNWQPMPYLNYLSWSYGFAVIAAFFLIFTSIAQVCYTSLERNSWKRDPFTQGSTVQMAPGIKSVMR